MKNQKKDTILFLYHKRLGKIDGNALYVRKLIDSLSMEYEVVIPSEDFYKSNLRVSGNWLIRTLEVNLFSIFWFFRNFRTLRGKVRFVIMEDRYSIITDFFVRNLKTKFLARISDWGMEYVDSLQFGSKIVTRAFALYERIYERFIFSYADAVIVPSEYLRCKIAVRPKFPVLVFPHTFDRNTVVRSERGASKKSELEGEINCIFVGNYEYTPNETAALFIIEQLAGEIYVKDKGLKFIIAGPGGIEKFGRTDTRNVEIHGLVNDLEALYERCDIGLNPSETVGGISVKIIEYLSRGLLVLSTPQSSRGIIECNRVVIAERKDFKDTLLKLAERIRTGGVNESSDESERINDYYSWSKNTDRLLNFLRSLEST